MKRIYNFGMVALLGLGMGVAHAVPVLQVGAPAGPGDAGTYADYQANTSDPTETDTAITSGSIIFAAGLYQNDSVNSVISLGGANELCLSGDCNYSDYGYDSSFNSAGAVLLVAVPDGNLGTANSNLTVDGSSAFYTSATLAGLFPNNHDPLKDGVSDFLFFDIGDFAKSVLIPDFADESIGSKQGEIKTLTLGGTTGLEWLHFDLLAIQTNTQGQSNIVTSLENNPASHDVTWKEDDGTPPEGIPEPGMMGLLGLGLLSMGMVGWRRSRG